MRSLPLICVLALSAASALAEAPEVPSNAPFLVLADNLDEPNGYGFCIDTAGRGQTDILQAHTCKPARQGRGPHDTQFAYDAVAQRVESVAFPGQCMQVLRSPYTTVFGLLTCSDHSRQQFLLSEQDGTLRMAEDPSLCVGVTNQTVAAGPWSRRDLALTVCDDTDAAVKQWTFVAE